MKHIIIDLEMNPIAREYTEERKICGREIIEIGAVIMDEQYMILGEFKTLVRPEYNEVIERKFETMTGISTRMVDGAPTFATALDMLYSWAESYGDDYQIYGWSESDYEQILNEMILKGCTGEGMEQFLFCWNDFQIEFSHRLGLERIMSLEKAIEYCGLDFEGHQHDALCDAKNTAEIFAIVRNEKRCKKVLKYVLDALTPKKVECSLGDLFDFSSLLAQTA